MPYCIRLRREGKIDSFEAAALELYGVYRNGLVSGQRREENFDIGLLIKTKALHLSYHFISKYMSYALFKFVRLLNVLG